MSKASRLKGHGYERKIAKLFRKIDGYARRNLEYQEGCGRDIGTLLPLSIQCKCLKRWSTTPHAILEDASRDATDGTLALGVVKIDHKKELAIMYLDDLFSILEEYYASKNKWKGNAA